MLTQQPLSYDLIDAEVHQQALRNIASEMAITLMRTSGSPVVTDGKDFSTCLLDADVEQLAFSGYVTFHISTAVLGVEAVLRYTPVAEIAPGDVFLCNDPHSSGAIHQGDAGIVMPFFYGDELVAWGYVNEHVLDIGGSAVSGFAPAARDSYAETLAFPAVRLGRNGRLDSEWERFIGTNVRLPMTVLNDIRSMVAANNAGQRRLTQLLDACGVDTYRSLNEANKQLSETAVRQRVRALRDGTYDSMDWVEYDARGVEELHEVRCRVAIDGDEMTIQLRGGPQTDSFINGARPAMIGQAWTTLVAQLIYDIPINAGIWRPIHFDLGPEGTIVNSVAPAPVSQSHMETGMRVNKLLIDALSQASEASEDQATRGRLAGQMSENLSFFSAFGIDRRTGQPTIAYPLSLAIGCGGGAQTVTDGQETYAAQCMAGCDMPDVEIEESTQPGMILWRRIQPDTGGAGTFRGGPGVSSAIAIIHADTLNGGAYGSCAYVPPRGAAGGYPGGAGDWDVTRDSNVLELLADGQVPTPEVLTGRSEVTPAKSGELTLYRGDVFTVRGGGGGGIGDPLLRSPKVVAKDVQDGYVTREGARVAYGVELTDGGDLDDQRTEALRQTIRTARLGHSPSLPAAGLSEVRALRTDGDIWACAHCGQSLGSTRDNWRLATVCVETEASARLEEMGSWARSHNPEPAVVIRENYCPGCGGTLAVDVALANSDMVAAARPDVVERWE
jgi:N-methylhydantoinase B